MSLKELFNPNEEVAWVKWLAEAVSLISTPPFVAFGSIVILAYHYGKGWEEFGEYLLFGAGLILGPALIYAGIRAIGRKKMVDIDMTNRQDRIIPLMLMTLGTLVLNYIINQRLPGSVLSAMSYLLVFLAISLTLITMSWKISLHTTTFVTLVTFSTIFVSGWLAFLYPLVIIIAWGRYYLRKHTMAQLLGGSILGLGMTLLIKIIFFK